MALENSGFSLADAMAMTNGNNNGFGGAGGTWIWVFFLFFLLAWGGNGFFGGGSNSAMESALTRAELYQGLGQQDVFRNQSDIAAELNAFERDAANNWGAVKYDNLQNLNTLQTAMTNGFYGLGTQLSENRYSQQECCCTTNRNIDAVRYENAKNTCDIITAQNENTQRILDAMMQNQIQTLRDELSTTRAALSNNLQTQNILGALQPIPRPAYVTTSPYTSSASNYCGCGI